MQNFLMLYSVISKINFLFAVFCLSIFISGCGYQFGQGESLSTRYNSISVPYVVGDVDGALTAAVIKEIVSSGVFTYQQHGGSLILKIKQTDVEDENIGFRYDRKKRGKLTKDIIPTETRVISYVEVSVIEAATCKTIIGPVLLSAQLDFDHDYYSNRDGVNIFSLGQLNDIDAAYDAVLPPLNRILAQKIVDYVIQSW